MTEFFIALAAALLFVFLFLLFNLLLLRPRRSRNLVSVIYLDCRTSNPEFAIRSAVHQNRLLGRGIPLILVDGGMRGESRRIAERLACRYDIPIVYPRELVFYFRELK